MSDFTRRLQRFHLWPVLAGLSLALGTGLTVLDAGAHSVPPAAALTLPLRGLPGSIDRLANTAQPPDAAAPDLLAGLLPTPTLQKAAPASVADPAATARIQQGYGRLPMHFEPNQGQTAPEVRYLARGAGYSLFLTDTEAVLVLRKAVGPAASQPVVGPIAPRSFQRAIAPFSLQGAGTPFSLQGASVGMPSWPSMIPESMRDAVGAGFKPAPALELGGQSETDPPQAAVVRMRLTGPTHNPAPAVAGLELQPGISNYILGNDPAKWRSGVPHYARVQYDQVYPGIDLVYYGNPQRLEYDLVVAPGADPGQIRLSFEGVDGMRIDGEGNLVLAVAGGEIVQQAPRVFQLVEGHERLVAGRYVLLDGDDSGGAAGRRGGGARRGWDGGHGRGADGRIRAGRL